MPNCKPGDIARVIGPKGKQTLVALVQVRSECDLSGTLIDLPDDVVWHCTVLATTVAPNSVIDLLGLGLVCKLVDWAPREAGRSAHLPDSYLRKLADPGDDTTDEEPTEKPTERLPNADQPVL